MSIQFIWITFTLDLVFKRAEWHFSRSFQTEERKLTEIQKTPDCVKHKSFSRAKAWTVVQKKKKKEKTILLLGMASSPVVKITSPSCTGRPALSAGHLQILMRGSPCGGSSIPEITLTWICAQPTQLRFKKKNESINSPCQWRLCHSYIKLQNGAPNFSSPFRPVQQGYEQRAGNHWHSAAVTLCPTF